MHEEGPVVRPADDEGRGIGALLARIMPVVAVLFYAAPTAFMVWIFLTHALLGRYYQPDNQWLLGGEGFFIVLMTLTVLGLVSTRFFLYVIAALWSAAPLYYVFWWR